MIRRYDINVCCLALLMLCSGSSCLSAQEYFPWNSGFGANQPSAAVADDSDPSGNPVPPEEPSELDTVVAAVDPSAAEDAESPVSNYSNGQHNVSDYLADQVQQLTSRKGTASTIQVGLLLAALSLAPALVLMTTSYVRVVVVLSLLRQAFGAQQLPPTQVLTTLSLFLTLLIMAPVWSEIKTEAIDPYTDSTAGIEWNEAWQRGVIPIKKFMSRQIDAAQNGESIAILYKYLPESAQQMPTSYEDVPLNVLLPAFMISELKVAFLLGFQIYLPFLVVDLVVSTVTVSMGMLMLPPTMVSFPLKLILFVMVDGWNLVVGMLLQSFGPLG